jgi:hypothetical protein
MTLPTADPTLSRVMQYHEMRAARMRFISYEATTREAKLVALREELEATRRHERYLEATLAELEEHDGE